MNIRALTAGLTIGALMWAAIFFGCGNDSHHRRDECKVEQEELRGLIANLDSRLSKLDERVDRIVKDVDKLEKKCEEDCCKK